MSVRYFPVEIVTRLARELYGLMVHDGVANMTHPPQSRGKRRHARTSYTITRGEDPTTGERTVTLVARFPADAETEADTSPALRAIPGGRSR